ncbi:NUDIX hydrolase domain-like protein [Russula aff. rugulosa BPL654]|nr:NUDIX hydrolase domain-like protein [Russula aff. rugulosa BPL654]
MGQHKYYSPQAIFSHPSVNFAYSHSNGHCYNHCTTSAQAAFATIDLSGYDAEQSRLMDERCIIVDEQDRAIGALDKKTCHLMENINKGLLHRAFSALVFRPSDGKLLLQQRASEKIPSPICGRIRAAPTHSTTLRRRRWRRISSECACCVQEARTRARDPARADPRGPIPIPNRIHYLAPSDGMWGEHEVDYILFLTADVTVNPNANEIRDYKYVDKAELQAMFEDQGNSFTPWFKLIARDFLFGWWDELLARKQNGIVNAKSLEGLVDGSKVVKMV